MLVGAGMNIPPSIGDGGRPDGKTVTPPVPYLGYLPLPMSSDDVSIGLVHNRIMSYRVPFFERIAERYDVTFLISRESSGTTDGNISPRRFRTYFGIAVPLLVDLARGDYDVIVNSEIGGVRGLLETTLVFLIAKLRGIPHVMWTERYDAPTSNVRTEVLSLVYRLILPRSAVCFVPAARHRRFALDCGAAEDDVIQLPTVSRLADRPDDYGTGDGSLSDPVTAGPTVLFVGRLEEIKGAEYLLRAFSTLRETHPDASLVVVGSGSDEDRVRSIADRLALSDVTFAGWQSRSALPEYYEAADLLILPSVTLPSALSGGSLGDAFGLVCLEAAAFGTPVVCTNAVGAAHDVVRDGENGYVVPEKDACALAEAMREVLSDPESMAEMATRSEEIARRFSYDRMEEAFARGIAHAIGDDT